MSTTTVTFLDDFTDRPALNPAVSTGTHDFRAYAPVVGDWTMHPATTEGYGSFVLNAPAQATATFTSADPADLAAGLVVWWQEPETYITVGVRQTLGATLVEVKRYRHGEPVEDIGGFNAGSIPKENTLLTVEGDAVNFQLAVTFGADGPHVYELEGVDVAPAWGVFVTPDYDEDDNPFGQQVDSFSVTYTRPDNLDTLIEVIGTDVPVPTTVAMAGAERGPVARGPRIRQAGAEVPAIAALVYRPLDIGGSTSRGLHRASLVTRLDRAWGRTWQDRLNDVGSGQLVLANDDPQLALVNDGDLVRFELYGEAAMSWFVEDRERHAVAEGEEADQTTTLQGPAHVSLLGQSLVYPARARLVWPPPASRPIGGLPIEEDRIFAWSALGFPDGAWGRAAPYGRVRDDSPAWTGLIDAWPVGSDAQWLWAPGFDTSFAASGSCYFRHQFDLAAATTLVVYVAADDEMHVYLDGAKAVDRAEWYNSPGDVQSFRVDVDAGTHCIAALCSNGELAPTDPHFNPAGFACTVYAAQKDGSVVGPILDSDATWKLLAYPTVAPGMTPGQILLTVLGEANQRRGFPQIAAAFNERVDSDGAPWAVAGEVATKVGTTVLDFAKELAATYIDFWMEPGTFTLHAWNKDKRGRARNVTLTRPTDPTDPYSGNLAGLVHHVVS